MHRIANRESHNSQNRRPEIARISAVRSTQVPGIKMMSLLILVVVARFLALTAKYWQVNDHNKGNHEPVQNYNFGK